MPPARPRALADDSRSETSSTITNLKDRSSTTAGVVKSKKTTTNSINNTNSTFKTAAVNGALAAAVASSAAGGAVVVETELPHTDWTSLPISTLHSYRSAYKLQIPPSYTQPHGDLLYRSSDVALRAPSVVLARKKLRDLKQYRKNLAQAQTNGHTNGLRKGSKAGKSQNKDKDSTEELRDGRRKEDVSSLKEKHNMDDTSIAQSIEPLSPATASLDHTTQPSLIPTATAAAVAENLSVSGSNSDQNPNQPSSTLNQADPESTIIGRQSPNSLATNIRKHFNAQQLNEAETIARFTYVVRQQGAGLHSRQSHLAAHPQSHASAGAVLGNSSAGTGTNASASTAASRVNTGLGGGHIHVEGADGDGDGWVMGRNGRQIRMSDGGSGGTFRLRFRP